MRLPHLYKAFLPGLPGLLGLAAMPAFPQDVASAPGPAIAPVLIDVTGSRLQRDAGSMPLTVLGKGELEAAGLVTAERLLLHLNIAGNGSDNLASNAGIVSEEQRGNNGVSGANLRGQGADATLVLLNGRRVATHGLKGRSVDLNSIPFAALQRVEVLRDGASAVYGTDAIGGVINFITRDDFRGLQFSASTDLTGQGGGAMHQLGLLAGSGDLVRDGYNLFATLSWRRQQPLFGTERDFTTSFQPARGLSPDTRGPAFANVFSVANQPNLIGNGLQDPQGFGTMTAISPLDLPGGAGCESLPLMGPYDERLWVQGASRHACAWDYPRAQALLQGLDSVDLLSRASVALGPDHSATLELTASTVDTRKSFEPYQISPGATFGPASWYPAGASAYARVAGALADYFGADQLQWGAPIAYRWRCMDCGNREIGTDTDSWRVLAAFEGTLGVATYDVGLMHAQNRAGSELGAGYYYTDALASLLGSGTLNPFLLPGEAQEPAALAQLKAASAEGVQLYTGRSLLSQFDASLTAPLPAWFGIDGMALAAGVELRREQFRFDGDRRAAARPVFLAPFDENNILDDVQRDIAALYLEARIPLGATLDLNLAGRHDRYSGFGASSNPKYSLAWRPHEAWTLRSSYSRGFKVPSFNQLFNGVTELPYTGLDLADPFTCPGALANEAVSGCAAIQPVQVFGGNPALQPETSSQYSVGLQFDQDSAYGFSVDWWQIERRSSIRAAAQEVLLAWPERFSANWLRAADGRIVAIDRRYLNSGGSLMRGVDLDASVQGSLGAGSWRVQLNGSYLQDFRTRGLDVLPWSENLVGSHVRFFSLPLRWKHSLGFSYLQGDWSHTLTQVYRSSYRDEPPVSVANGSFVPAQWNPRVEPWRVYHYSLAYSGLRGLRLSATVQNLFDTAPPFTAHQNDFSAGGGWEPRVADPRGRALLLSVEYTL